MLNRMKIILPLMVFCYAAGIFAAGGSKHHAGIFSGATTNFHAKHTDLTLGAEYEYRFHGIFGAGVLADFIFAKHFETLAAPMLLVHPWRGSKLLLAPGVVLVDGNSYFALRAGVGYDFHVGNVSFGPMMDLDLINGHYAFVYGATVGFGF